MSEEQQNLMRLLESGNADYITLGLQIATNGEKQNLETLLMYFEKSLKRNYYKYTEFTVVAKILLSFTHCNKALSFDVCKKICKELSFVKYPGRFYNEEMLLLKRLMFFFKHTACKKGLSYYLSK